MKLFNRYTIYILAVFTMLACQKDDWAPYPDWNESVGAATKLTLSTDVNRNQFKLGNGIANEFIEFTLDVDGYDLTEVTSVELELRFTEASPARVVGPVILKTIDSFPSTVRVTSQEVADAIATATGTAFPVTAIQNSDQFRLTFPINTADGRRLTVALNSELCTNAAQPLFGSCQYNWAVIN